MVGDGDRAEIGANPDPDARSSAGNSFVPASFATAVLFVATAACSAFLLFWCQPLIAKALLPLLGGAPSVWNTTMMFFQTILLAGYLYAHALSRLPRSRQALIHGMLLLLSLWVLPFGNTAQLAPPTQGSPVPWLIATLLGNVGLPFFALSASAPLLQSWYQSRHAAGARDPYFLYAGSNAGSLAALLGFPLLLEPWLSLDGQRRIWAALFVAVGLLLAACLGIARDRPANRAAYTIPPSWPQRGIWVFLGFIPSSLLLGVTAYVSTDVASVPLLWVLPLALYLVTFIIAFGRSNVPQAFLRSVFVLALSVSGALLLLARLSDGASMPVLIATHFGAFFLIALVCHCTVATRRPPADRLTEFYVFLSAGGALGGIFNAIIAPLLFNWTYEYEIVLVASCLVGFLLGPTSRPRPLYFVIPLSVILVIELSPHLLNWADGYVRPMLVDGLVIGCGIALVFTGAKWPAVFAATLGGVLLGGAIITNRGNLHTERSFFGVHRVVNIDGGALVGLMHGNILHGSEYTDPARWEEKLGYYTPAGPIGQIIAAGPQIRQVGVIGLGTGTMACYATPQQEWNFFEIDPAIVKLARNPKYFHFLQNCGASVKIALGDGRLALKDTPGKRYDLLVVDAFSSDSIPLHLLTKEAFDLYASRLARGGWLVLHISNHYLKLAPTIAVTSAAAGFSGYDQIYVANAGEVSAHALSSEWIVLSRDASLSGKLNDDHRWVSLTPNAATPIWTDSYSNILGVLR